MLMLRGLGGLVIILGVIVGPTSVALGDDIVPSLPTLPGAVPDNAPLPASADEDIDVMIGESPGHHMHPDPETGTVPVSTPLVPDLTDVVGDVFTTVTGIVTTVDDTVVTSDGTVVPTGDGTTGTTGSASPGGVPDPPPPPPPVDGGQVASGVADATLWPAPGIGYDPHGPDTPPLVNLDTWLYVTSGYAPHQQTVSQDGATVTVRWQPSGTQWGTGDGQAEHCSSAGEPYPPGTTNPPHAPCGHTYTSPSDPDGGGDTFTLRTATN